MKTLMNLASGIKKNWRQKNKDHYIPKKDQWKGYTDFLKPSFRIGHLIELRQFSIKRDIQVIQEKK